MSHNYRYVKQNFGCHCFYNDSAFKRYNRAHMGGDTLIFNYYGNSCGGGYMPATCGCGFFGGLKGFWGGLGAGLGMGLMNFGMGLLNGWMGNLFGGCGFGGFGGFGNFGGFGGLGGNSSVGNGSNSATATATTTKIRQDRAVAKM